MRSAPPSPLCLPWKGPIRGETLQVHIGIATGVVVVGEPISFGEARQQTAIGETPNLAARLEEIAEPDSIVIDDVTRRQIGGLFTCRDLGEISLKGFRTPVRAWRVLRERTAGDRFAARYAAFVPLVGREEELELLLRRWRMAKQGKGQLVLLAGEPGIGKSRLVVELRARLRGEPHASLRYFCSPHYLASPLYPVIARLQYEAGFNRRDGPTDKLRKLEAVLPPAGSSVEDFALLADLLGVPVGELYQTPDLSPQAKKQKTFEALTRRVVALARQRPPLLMIAEDIHWADPSSLELLDKMIDQLSDLPILLIVTYRAEFVPPWAEPANATLVTLNRLNHRDAARLATEIMTGYALPQALLERIVTQGDGVPLFIEELTKSLLENAESYVRSPPSLTVPQTLQASLTARLDRLPAAKRVAQVAATIGREFSQSLLAAVAQIPEKQLVDGLDQLIASGLASRRGKPADAHLCVQACSGAGSRLRQRAP